MKSIIEHKNPNSSFWQAYRQLWENSLHRSAFQSPGFIRFLAGLAKNNLAVYQCYEGEKLIGAAFFKGEKGKFQFLSDLKADHNFFVISRQCTGEQVREFFNRLMQAVKSENWALFLDKQPSWASYYDTLLTAIQFNGLHWETSKYSTCLTLEENVPEKLLGYFDRQKLPQRFRRLKNASEFQFEVFENDEALDQWVEDYTLSHVKRWKGTNTPSNLSNPGRREFLKNCLQAWINDGILVRFSINLDGNRIAFVIGLREENSLVFHATTYDADYGKYSPGLVLLHLLGQWMAAENISKLDFGDGDETYKSLFSNKASEINRIYISDHSNLPFIVKAKFIKALRESPQLHRFYLEQIKPLAQKFFL